MGISATSNDYFSHIYDNCVGLFIEPNDLLTGDKLDISLMSSQLELDSDSRYNTCIANHDTTNSKDQHTRNTILFPDNHWSNGGLAMIGTKTKDTYLFGNNDDFATWQAAYTEALSQRTWTNRVSYHDAVTNSTKGKALSAQFIVKPKFDLTEQNGVDVLSSNKDVTFELGKSFAENPAP